MRPPSYANYSNHSRLTLHWCSGSWKTADFKAYNFNALGVPTSGGYLHPLLKVGSPDAWSILPTWSKEWWESPDKGLRAAGSIAVCLDVPQKPGSYSLQVQAQIRKIFTNMGFEEMPTNNYVESRCSSCLSFSL